MATSVDAAKRDPLMAPPATPQGMAPRSRAAVAANAPGLDMRDFVAANRIHVKYGSLFVDPYLVIHPRELDPKNEPALREKLRLTYSINNPSFFESPDRSAIALNLGQLIPPSLTAKRSALMEQVKQFNTQVDSQTDAGLMQQAADKRNPFSAIVRDTVENPTVDPVGLELLRHGIGVYMLIREKLTRMGYMDKLTSYVMRQQTPDQVLADLADKIGTDPRAFREAALKGGLDGVGQLLGLDPAYTADVKKLVDYAQSQDFGYNLVEHWHLGRQLLGVGAPLEHKLATGMDARITAKIEDYRRGVMHHYDVPTPVNAEEQRIAGALELVEPIQRALMFRLGYEICYSPEMTADDVAFFKGIYGLHRKAANDLSDVRGTYRIYFSGHGDLKRSYRTLCHEIAHNLWPKQFTREEAARIDQLANLDAERFKRWQGIVGDPAHFEKFEKLFHAYKAAGTDAERAAVVAATDEWLAARGVTVDGLFPQLNDAHDFQFMVKHALDALTVEGDLYNRSGYDSPQERFREVISRFAELKQVEYRSQPQLLQFLCPGLNDIFENHYLPHLERVYHQIGPQPSERLSLKQLAAPKAPVTVAPIAPFAMPAPANDARIGAIETPKVEDRPAMPPAAEIPAHPATPRIEMGPTPISPVQKMSIETPSNSIEAASIKQTPQTLAAMSALQSMGAHG